MPEGTKTAKTPEEQKQTLTTYLAELKAKGLDDDEALMLANAKFGGGDRPPGVPIPGTAGAGEMFGPDPERVRRYKEMLKTYKRPKLRFAMGALDKDDAELHEKIIGAIKATMPNMAKGNKEGLTQAIAEALHEFGGMELPEQFHRWAQQWRYWQSEVRQLDEVMTETELMTLVLKEHWHLHAQERAMLQSGGRVSTGPKNLFSKTTGAWQA